jgi:hypothetical protein
MACTLQPFGLLSCNHNRVNARYLRHSSPLVSESSVCLLCVPMSSSDNEFSASFDDCMSDDPCADESLTLPYYKGVLQYFGVDDEESLVLVLLLSLGLCNLVLFVLMHIPQAIKDSRLHSHDLQAQVKQLKAKNSMLASQQPTKELKLALTAEDREIQHAGERFAFPYELWIG